LGTLPRNLACVLLIIFAAMRTPAAGAPATWLDRLNFYRAIAALPPVSEAPSLSAPVSLHARYMVMHDVIIHSEKRRLAGATAEGAEAAAVSNLAGSLSADEPDAWAVDTAETSPNPPHSPIPSSGRRMARPCRYRKASMSIPIRLRAVEVSKLRQGYR
jgi:hypothetical protein